MPTRFSQVGGVDMMVHAARNQIACSSNPLPQSAPVNKMKIYSEGYIATKKSTGILKPGIEPGTSAVLKPRHNQLDHLSLRAGNMSSFGN
jgi:hypothetical protein